MAHFLPIRSGMKTLCSPFTRLVVVASLLAACSREREPAAGASSGTVLRVHTTQRNSFQRVATDTISDSAQILEILPEQDGDALVALFTDPGRVSNGLAIIDRKMLVPQLLWPDSVTSVWWTGPHILAFTTSNGSGIRLVVDVHAAELRLADTTESAIPRPAPTVMSDSSMLQRARAYTDSLRGQVGGASQTSTLTYSVMRLVPSADGRLAAFHTAARDAAGTLTNPAWYALDRESGVITLIDQVTGSIKELPERAGQWSQGNSFFYAKGRALWEAEVSRGTPASS